MIIESFASKGGRLVNVVCDCGIRKPMKGRSLASGDHTSCGCMLGGKTHGHSSRKKYGSASPEYRIWSAMKRRCYDPNDAAYEHYGGRGIGVCERWLHSFADFLADVGPRPSPQFSLDRFPNNDGNYEPGNVRWATRSEQMRNQRGNRRVEYAGESLTIVEWSERLGLSFCGVAHRLRNYPVNIALVVPKVEERQDPITGRFRGLKIPTLESAK